MLPKQAFQYKAKGRRNRGRPRKRWRDQLHLEGQSFMNMKMMMMMMMMMMILWVVSARGHSNAWYTHFHVSVWIRSNRQKKRRSTNEKIIITYLSWSWATCWPVPVSRIQKSLQRSAMIPSASWGIVFNEKMEVLLIYFLLYACPL